LALLLFLEDPISPGFGEQSCAQAVNPDGHGGNPCSSSSDCHRVLCFTFQLGHPQGPRKNIFLNTHLATFFWSYSWSSPEAPEQAISWTRRYQGSHKGFPRSLWQGLPWLFFSLSIKESQMHTSPLDISQNLMIFLIFYFFRGVDNLVFLVQSVVSPVCLPSC